MEVTRARVGRRLRRLADRIDDDGAPRILGWTFTFERHEGVRWRTDGRGCRVAYLARSDYDRAYTESDTRPQRIDWRTMKVVDY